MKGQPTYEELQVKVQRLTERVAYLERLLWGGKRDKKAVQGPTLFDGLFNEAAASKASAIAETVEEIRKEAENAVLPGKRNQGGLSAICIWVYLKNGIRNTPAT